MNSVEFYDNYDLREYAAARQAYIDGIDSLILRSVKPGSSILDVGSGDGVRIKTLADKIGASVIAMDNSPGMVRRCKQIGLEAYCGDIENCIFHMQFDVVTCLWSVFGYVNPGPALKNMACMLKPGGQLFLDVNVCCNVAEYGLWNSVRNLVTGRRRFPVKGTDCLVYMPDYWELDRHFRAAGLKFRKEYRSYKTGGWVEVQEGVP